MMAARLSPGAISESNSSQLPPIAPSKLAKPVVFPLRTVEAWDDAAGDGIAHAHEDNRDRPRLPLDGSGPRGGTVYHNDVGLQADQLLRERSYPIDVTAAPPQVHPHVAAIGPTQARKGLRERRDVSLQPGIVFVAPYEHADAPDAVALLRLRHNWPTDGRASERDYEFSSCNRDSHWTPLRQVSTLGSGTIPCFGGCMNPLIQPPSRPDACYGS